MGVCRRLLTAALLPSLGCGLGFDQYLKVYRKSYSASEHAARQDLFEARHAEVEELNARPGASWTAGINALSDLSEIELQQFRGYNKALREAGSGGSEGKSHGGGFLMQAAAVVELPQRLDWREHYPSVVTPVKTQGSCGSCWAFSAAESIESHVALATGKLLSLSPQQLTSCTPNPDQCGGGGGCSGATAQLAFNYTIHAGLSEIWQWAYESGTTGQSGECQEAPGLTVARITGFAQLPRNQPRALLEAVATVGPVSVIADASKWYLYDQGVFDHCNNTHPNLNHAVQLVGYGASAGTKYWLLRNSWGTMWGEDGYMRLRRHAGFDAHDPEPCGEDVTPESGFGCEGGPSSVEACGECGILADSAHPLGGSFGYLWDDESRRLQEDLAPILV